MRMPSNIKNDLKFVGLVVSGLALFVAAGIGLSMLNNPTGSTATPATSAPPQVGETWYIKASDLPACLTSSWEEKLARLATEHDEQAYREEYYNDLSYGECRPMRKGAPVIIEDCNDAAVTNLICVRERGDPDYLYLPQSMLTEQRPKQPKPDSDGRGTQ